MAMDILTYGEDMYPVVLDRFQDRLSKRVDLIKSVIGYKKITKGDQYKEQGIGGYGYVPVYDGNLITELSQKRGFTKTYTPEEHAASATMSYKYNKTDQSGEAERTGTKMADSITITRVRDFYNMFARGWNASFVGADGKALFATDHPVNNEPGADTFSNTGKSVFSVEAISISQAAAQRFKTFDGADFDCDFDLVLIPPELEAKAKEFFGTEAKLIPGSAENGANPVSGMKYTVIKGLGAKQWIVADSNLLKEYMKLVEITEPMVVPANSTNPLVKTFVGYSDYCFGWSDSRMLIGHNPT